ncbi:MAG: methyltransferase domain-containing protein [Saprospiraceae bacterium]|nr:methyltransferase domain-containing protein [Saprospiraceae bacterium]
MGIIHPCHELANTNLKEVVRKIKIPPTATQLLDLGGSHGLYSIEFCKKYPNLKAEIIDYEPVRQYAQAHIEKHAMDGRVTFTAADFMKEDLPLSNDIVLLFQIIHQNVPEQNIALFKKIHAVLRQGGQLIILEQIKGIGGASQLSKSNTSFIALNLFHQASGNAYTFEEVRAWAIEAGFRKHTLKKLNAPGFGLIVCEK